MSEHTSGVWEARDTGMGWVVRSIYTDDQGRRCTAYLAQLSNVIEPSEANARLFAAAPDLLEALKGMIDAYWRGSEDSDDAHAPTMVKAALAAIAKADHQPSPKDDEAAFEAWWKYAVTRHPDINGRKPSARRGFLAGRSSSRPSPTVERREQPTDDDIIRAYRTHAIKPGAWYSRVKLLAAARDLLALAQHATGAVEGEGEPAYPSDIATKEAFAEWAALKTRSEREAYRLGYFAPHRTALPAGEWTDEREPK